MRWTIDGWRRARHCTRDPATHGARDLTLGAPPPAEQGPRQAWPCDSNRRRRDVISSHQQWQQQQQRGAVSIPPTPHGPGLALRPLDRRRNRDARRASGGGGAHAGAAASGGVTTVVGVVARPDVDGPCHDGGLAATLCAEAALMGTAAGQTTPLAPGVETARDLADGALSPGRVTVGGALMAVVTSHNLASWMDVLERTIGGLRALCRVPDGFTWSNVANPLIWWAACPGGRQLLRGALDRARAGHQAADLVAAGWGRLQAHSAGTFAACLYGAESHADGGATGFWRPRTYAV